VVDFDCSVKGNRLVLIKETSFVSGKGGHVDFMNGEKGRKINNFIDRIDSHTHAKKRKRTVCVYRVTHNQIELMSEQGIDVGVAKVRIYYPKENIQTVASQMEEYVVMATSDLIEVHYLHRDGRLVKSSSVEYLAYDGKVLSLEVWRNYVFMTNDSKTIHMFKLIDEAEEKERLRKEHEEAKKSQKVHVQLGLNAGYVSSNPRVELE
jgi:hypothetical protein